MTRKEYIDALAFGLEGFDDASRRDIILEIEDHIDELALKHPEMAEEAIVAGLEKPDILAASLCKEAGIPGQKRAYGADSEDDGREGAERGHQRGKARITIDGEDLGDFIRRAFDVAKLFKESKEFDEEDGGRGSESESDKRANGGGGRTLRFKDIPIGSVKEIVCGTKSADLRIFLSYLRAFPFAGVTGSKTTVDEHQELRRQKARDSDESRSTGTVKSLNSECRARWIPSPSRPSPVMCLWRTGSAISRYAQPRAISPSNIHRYPKAWAFAFSASLNSG